jgi:hypothetical protein
MRARCIDFPRRARYAAYVAYVADAGDAGVRAKSGCGSRNAIDTEGTGSFMQYEIFDLSRKMHLIRDRIFACPFFRPALRC